MYYTVYIGFSTKRFDFHEICKLGDRTKLLTSVKYKHAYKHTPGFYLEGGGESGYGSPHKQKGSPPK